jgi:hypothetical protein
VLALELGDASHFLDALANELVEAGCFRIARLAHAVEVLLVCDALTLEVGKPRRFLVALARELGEPCAFLLLLRADRLDGVLRFEALALGIGEAEGEVRDPRDRVFLLRAQVVEASLLLLARALEADETRRLLGLALTLQLTRPCDLGFLRSGELRECRCFRVALVPERFDLALCLETASFEIGESACLLFAAARMFSTSARRCASPSRLRASSASWVRSCSC